MKCDKKKCLLALVFLSSLLMSLKVYSNEPETNWKYVELVNPFVDSHRSRWFFFSSACRPFGMVSLSPDTDTEHSWGSGYMYGSKYIRCFSHIHNWQMSGVAVMPTVGPFKGHLGMDSYQSEFTHEGEIAKPGFHKVKLTNYDVTAELTSTIRVGFHRYTFPQSDSSYVLFDTGAFLAHGPTAYSEVWKISDTEIAGWEIMERTGRRPKDTPVYFYAQLSKPVEQIVTWREGKIVPNTKPERISGKNVGLAVKFRTKANEKVLLKVAISYVSVEQARKNLYAELESWNFEEVKHASFDEWNTWLGKIEVEGGSREQQIKFYTDLWHALLGRRVLAALAKVLKDLPETDQYRQEYIDRFQTMAKSVAACQQPEGYWTRSMLDPEHAPGPETSGTAFFTYGLLWGMNNGLLDKAAYQPVVMKAWNYLTTVALQPDGRIGYVQPIGEKAIPGQVVDANSTANFGVGAFLLAACEMVRFLNAD